MNSAKMEDKYNKKGYQNIRLFVMFTGDQIRYIWIAHCESNDRPLSRHGLGSGRILNFGLGFGHGHDMF